MRLSDLQQKDIVSLVEEKMHIRNIFNSSGEISIYFSNIKKIGNDVILVDL